MGEPKFTKGPFSKPLPEVRKMQGDPQSSYENTRQTEPEGSTMPPWDKLSLGVRVALINAFRDGGRHSLDMISHQFVDRSPSPTEGDADLCDDCGSALGPGEGGDHGEPNRCDACNVTRREIDRLTPSPSGQEGG
jgi:hypothetical protein